MLKWLAQFLTAPIVNGFIDAYKARLEAENSQDRTAADLAAKAIAAEIEARKSADAIIIAEQGRWYTAIIRPLLAAPVIIYLWKVIVWDKVLGLGTTDADQRRRRRLGRRHRHDLCRRPLAREDRQARYGAGNERRAVRRANASSSSSRRSPTSRTELDRMSAKVDEMHAILLQAKGVRWAIVAVSGLVGFVTGISHWLISKA